MQEVVRERREADYYVLQNDSVQYVFSTIGGALAEINLPLQGKEHPSSIVKPINIDTLIAHKYPDNALFPLYAYSIVEEGKKVTKEPTEGGYTPLLRRDLAGTPYTKSFLLAPKYYALNLLSDEEESLANIRYNVQDFSAQSITFEATLPDRRITKTFSLPKEGSFFLDLAIRIDGMAHDLWLSTGVPEAELVSGNAAPFLKYQIPKNGKTSTEKLKLPKNTTVITTAQPNWICNANGFFAFILDPTSPIRTGLSATFVPGQEAPSRLTIIDAQYNLYPPTKYPGYFMILPLKKGAQTTTFRFFTPPLDQGVLKTLDTITHLDLISMKSSDSWFYFIADPFSKFLYLIMSLFYRLIHSWGFSIIFLTIVLRIMMYPLNSWSIRAMARMQKLQPLITKLDEKYKKDPQRLQMEKVQLMREHKANPLSGCLPLFIQLPLLFGMFDLLKTTFALRGAGFIPGWITNLSAPDVLFAWSYPIVFFGTQFHLLPFLLGGVMIFQQKAMGKNPAATAMQKQQTQMMAYLLPLILTFVFYNFPSGLNIYWICSSLLDMLQRWWMHRTQSSEKIEVAKRVDE